MECGTAEHPTVPSLADWTRRLGCGDEEAWDWFHNRHYLSLLRYATSRTGDPSAASEIVQNTYMRVARHVRPFSVEQDFSAWLACLVRCAAVDHARGITRRSLLLEKFAHWRDAGTQSDCGLAGGGNNNRLLAEEALDKLPLDDAQLLRRKYYDGWSVVELAADTNTTPKAIENRLARLRERLREIIINIR